MQILQNSNITIISSINGETWINARLFFQDDQNPTIQQIIEQNYLIPTTDPNAQAVSNAALIMIQGLMPTK